MSRKRVYLGLLEDAAFFRWMLHPTPALDAHWKEIMQTSPEMKEAIDELKTVLRGMKVQEEGLSAEAQKELWRRIEASVCRKRHTFRLKPLLRYAALFCLLLSAGAYWIFTKNGTPEDSIDYQSLVSDTVLTTGRSGKVTIVLANQEKIEVEETAVELRHDMEGRMSVNSVLIKTDGGKEPAAPSEKQENRLNRLFVPYGKTTHLVMSDGSKVWVNSGSRMIYPSVFAENRREIYVEGEIYLEVARNEQAPFIVKTDLLEIDVLGTSFNVSAYKNDENQSVVLASGALAVKGKKEKTALTIRPNQKYTFEKSANLSGVQEVNVSDYTGWICGFLSLKNEKLSSVLHKVERYYNVRIDCDASLADRISVSGKLDLKENIEETFRIISITAPIEYVIRDNEISIHVKP
ncbi:MAG: FecR domain-containing protein [Tannerella sp.]|nr:FecR domain-containing protein [Tannerella sp.]